MVKKIIGFSLLMLLMYLPVTAQELQARISVNASAVGSDVDKKVFQTFQNSLIHF